MLSSDRQHIQAGRLLIATERRLETAVIDAMIDWQEATRFAILREVAGYFGVTAAGYPDPSRSVDAASAAYEAWRRAINNRVLPEVSLAFGEAYNQMRWSAEFSPARFEAEYMATVNDRLKIWPEGAFEDIRPELMEALAEGEDFDQIRDRVGRVLNIDARTRDLKARINEIDIELTDPMLDPESARQLRQARRDLWREHDESLGEWQWKARRIARTEAQGAVQGGKLAAARASEIATGAKYYKRWRATHDNRVRLSHQVADGQTVRLAERFRVGGFLLDHPADPLADAPHESINCRCSLSILAGENMLQDELQGPDGSMGEIRPGGVRLGPDDPDEADKVIAALAEETGRPAPSIGRRGEDHGQPPPGPIEDIELTDERERPAPDLTGVSDDELLTFLESAHDDNDADLFDWVQAEFDRRDTERDGELPDVDELPPLDDIEVPDLDPVELPNPDDLEVPDIPDDLSDTDLDTIMEWLVAEQAWRDEQRGNDLWP